MGDLGTEGHGLTRDELNKLLPSVLGQDSREKGPATSTLCSNLSTQGETTSTTATVAKPTLKAVLTPGK
jgi:hypothetical protein